MCSNNHKTYPTSKDLQNDQKKKKKFDLSQPNHIQTTGLVQQPNLTNHSEWSGVMNMLWQATNHHHIRCDCFSWYTPEL